MYRCLCMRIGLHWRLLIYGAIIIIVVCERRALTFTVSAAGDDDRIRPLSASLHRLRCIEGADSGVEGLKEELEDGTDDAEEW